MVGRVGGGGTTLGRFSRVAAIVSWREGRDLSWEWKKNKERPRGPSTGPTRREWKSCDFLRRAAVLDEQQAAYLEGK